MLNSSTIPLYIAIDIGKNAHCYAGYEGVQLTPLHAPVMVLSNGNGFQQFQGWLEELINSGQYGPIVIGLEPTGIYHESWVDALLRAFGERIQLKLLGTYQVSQRRKQIQNGRKKKTDPLDVGAMAYCLRDGLGNPVAARQADTVRFEVWMTAYRQTERALNRMSNQLLAQVDRLWPGMLLDVKAFQKAHPDLPLPEPLVRTLPFTRATVQPILADAPNPYDWLDWQDADIAAFYHTHGHPCGPKLIQRIRMVLDRLLLPTPAVASVLAEQLQSDFQAYLDLANRLAALTNQAEEIVPTSPAAVLTSIPGISAYTAARYAAFVGDPHRFQHAGQVWALAGLDLVTNDSGDRRHVGGLTKRGDPAFRHVLFSIGLTTSQQCPPIQAAKERALHHGKGKIGAVLHAAHKANRICFRLYRDQVLFDPTKLH